MRIRGRRAREVAECVGVAVRVYVCVLAVCVCVCVCARVCAMALV